MAATWNYDGNYADDGVVTVTIDDAVIGDTYQVRITDWNSSSPTVVASSSTVVVTATGIGGTWNGPGPSPGWQFFAIVLHGNPLTLDSDCAAANVFTEGEASTTGTPSSAVWDYDGATALSVTFTAEDGITYTLEATPSTSFATQSVTGGPYTAGTSQTLSLTLHTPNRVFQAQLYDDSTLFAYTDNVFTNGVTGGGGGPPPPPPPSGRVLIAFDDGPLEPNPTWTAIDQAGDFPDQFVSGYDTQSGRQTLLSQTDTGTATVYINDHDQGLFDPRNSSSPYFGKLDGRQIMLQLYNPVDDVWEPQFRGWIDDITWDIDGSATNPAGEPINASIQLESVDVFDFLAGFGLTPGLAGVVPPSGMEDGVYYAEAHVDDRVIEILTDVGLDPSRYHTASGNVRCRPVKYDPDESSLTGLRDAVDAELPFIANIYVDRQGRFVFRGRYSRFDPDTVSSEPGSDWDFTRWAVGDEAAILDDPTRAQMRVLSFTRTRSDIINAAICYPQNTKPADMPDEVYADTTSITAYGKHDAPPMSDLLTADDGLSSGFSDAKTECFHFAKLLVLNKKDPREAVSSLQVKAIHPDDYRATQTWAFLTRSDISHIVNVAVGYPAGTGFTGASPDDDYYIEGRSLQVRPLNPSHDYVELNLEVSPAVWSMDTHGVFPSLADLVSRSPEIVGSLTADFSVA